MMKALFALVAVASTLMSTQRVYADSADDVLNRFRALYPSTRIDAVKPSPLAGIWIIQMGRNVAYSDSAGRYLLFGAIFDSQTRSVIAQSSAPSDDDEKRIIVPEEYLKLAIKTVKGNGAQRLSVFSDPQCGYCKRLEPELAKLNDVTIYTFPYPILGEISQQLTNNVLCAKDQRHAWSNAMTKGAVPVQRACGKSFEQVLELGKSIGINGTPTLIAGDGRVLSGAHSAQDIQGWLAQ
jgi:thiol:disulfide interchange protein DsbC